MNEFGLIDTYFNWQTQHTHLGIGDDGAILNIPNGFQLISSTDTLITGVHFLEDTSPKDIAYKSLAVNLSDLAAMGATPKWFSLALTLPKLDQKWLSYFSASLKQLANEFKLDLIGGDITQGNLSINIHILGLVPTGQSLLRSGAKIGDDIYISNTLGNAALALKQLDKGQKNIHLSLLSALHRPIPQVRLGQSLIGIANGCIDISDGLIADLGHILKKSQVGAIIDLNALPLSQPVKHDVQKNKDWCLPLAGGDDYQLCFSVPKENHHKMMILLQKFYLTKIGNIIAGNGIKILDKKMPDCEAYQHF